MRSSTLRLFGQITPILARRRNVSGSSRKRADEIRIAPSSGISASSATCRNASPEIFPFLTSGIDPLPERFDAEPFHRVDEQLIGTGAQRQVSLDNILDHIGDLAKRHGRPDQGANLGVLVGAAADGDLIEFLAVLLDAENADMADMVMAAGIDAAGDVDV